jgi:hypothetical protein
MKESVISTQHTLSQAIKPDIKSQVSKIQVPSNFLRSATPSYAVS